MTSEKSINQSVLDFLDYYALPERPLNYAVLIDGPWGVGKTHLVRVWLNHLKRSGGKHLYISLYGIKSADEIGIEIFRQLHPILGSKGMRFAVGAIASAAKINLSFSQKGATTTETVGIGVPSIDVSEFFKGAREHILVFDDLERSAMPVMQVLGYVNSLVESDGLRVVLVGNQKEIIEKEPEFVKAREKVIGQTLRVSSDFTEAYESFLLSITDTRARALLNDHGQSVLSIFALSKTDNVRVLKQAMWDFERISKHLQEVHLSSKEGIDELLRFVTALSIELRVGRIMQDDLPTFLQDVVERVMNVKRGERSPTPGVVFESRYPGISLTKSSFRSDLIGRIIVEGANDKALLDEALRDSPYFAKPDRFPAWRRAWRSFESEDVDYEADLAEVVRLFDTRDEVSSSTLYHIFGILLRASDIGALEKTRAELSVDGKIYVDDLVKSGRIVTSIVEDPTIHGSRGSLGLGFTDDGSPEFSDFVRYYSDAAERASVASYGEIARRTLDRLEKDPNEFFMDLCINNVRGSPFWERPILSALPACEFVAKVLSLPVKRQVTAFAMLKGRYDHPGITAKLAPEESWLRQIRDLFLTKAKSARPLTRFRIEAMVRDDIDSSLDKFQSNEATYKVVATI